MSNNHALIFGASGITGWAITNALLHDYPSASAFSRVTALTNRPLPADVAQWPESPKLQVVSGLDLLTSDGQEGLEQQMKERIQDVQSVTHVYFFAYIMDPDPQKEISINVDLLTRAVTAAQHLCPNLRFVVLPTGTKTYGVHLLGDFPFRDALPLHEDLPPIPEPHLSQMFYYAQVAVLQDLSRGKAWAWCDLIPDNIIGFVPNNNVYCLAQTLATYLALFRAVEGPGAACAFPGNEKSWRIRSNECNQDTIAKFAVWASLHADVSGGKRFNVADRAAPSSWSRKWPVICEFFGLKGTPPPADGGSAPQPGQYVQEHLAEWEELERKHGLQTGRQIGPVAAGFQNFIMGLFDFDREMSVKRMQGVWGPDTIEMDEKESWWRTFERFRQAKIIP